MSEQATLRCGLPLLQPAQAQKHVTVNDGLMRLDGLVNLVLQSVTAASPPPAVTDGQCWAVPFGAGGPWAGQVGRIAIGANGGWVFAEPQRGQRAFVLDQGLSALWDGAAWLPGALTLGASGGGLGAGMTTGEVEITAGASLGTGVFIPANVLVLGVTGRVIKPVTGTLTSWMIGVTGATNRYGSGLGLPLNSWSQGLLSAPSAVYAAQELRADRHGGQLRRRTGAAGDPLACLARSRSGLSLFVAPNLP